MASATGVAGLEAPTEDERTMAMLAHLLMAFTGFIGPLVIFCVKQNSRFVRFHSLQALIWHAIYLGLIFVCMAVFFCGDDDEFDSPPAGAAQPDAACVRLFFSIYLAGIHGRVGGERDFGGGVRDQGEPGRVGDVSGVWEVAVARRDEVVR
jgi:hypothetical protein